MAKTRGKRELLPPKVAARSGGKRIAPFSKRPFGVMDGILLLLSGALLVVIFLAALLPRWMGYTPYAVSSDSMAPVLDRGDLLFVRPVTFDELEGGELVAFRAGEGVVTHRVHGVDRTGRSLLTKADASVYLDPAPVKEAQLLGRAVYKLPLLGYVSLFLGGEETAP